MKYTVCKSYEWTYPDIHSYKTAFPTAESVALKGGFVGFQIHIYDVASTVLARCSISDAQLFEEIPVLVEACPGLEKKLLHFPEREAPFYVNDCLKPCDGILEPTADSSCTLYVLIRVPVDARDKIIGTVDIQCNNETVSVPVNITVSDAVMPDERLEIVMGLSRYGIYKSHNAKTREEYDRLEGQYLSLLRHMHQNRLYVDTPTLRGKGENAHFDFSETDAFVERALAFGFHAFHLPDVGFRKSWEAPEINVHGYDSRSDECRAYLEKYLGELCDHLRSRGWLNMFCIGVADEPNEINAYTFRELSMLIRKICPEIKLYDAVSDVEIDRSLDIWVPRSDEYEKGKDRFEKMRNMGGELWHYSCLYPRENGYINRFMDVPLLCTRYLYWGNYRYSLKGYLHWTVNDYQGDLDPFRASCPVHINAGSKSILPPGDDKLIYPGSSGPWMSMRLEAYREGAEDYAILSAIAEVNKTIADNICNKVFKAFNDTELDCTVFEKVHDELIREYVKAVKTSADTDK